MLKQPDKQKTPSQTYCEPIKHRRCLVPADGFFEWKKLDAKNKQPFAFAPKDGSMIAFAGIWDRWRDEVTSQVLETYCIITTEPNELMAPIHPRMPAILAPCDYERGSLRRTLCDCQLIFCDHSTPSN